MPSSSRSAAPAPGRPMQALTGLARTLIPDRADPDGVLPPLLLALTIVTGAVDATSYIALGHVFVANMTGNIVLLGFAFAGASGLSITTSLAAVAAFLAGAAAGGRLGVRLGAQRTRLLVTAILIEWALVTAALVAAAIGGSPVSSTARYVLVVLLALPMGLQNATARRLAVPDLTTTVLTLTLTGLAADPRLAGGSHPHPVRRLLAVAAMFAGAVLGGMLVLHVAITASIGLAAGLLLAAGLAGLRRLASAGAAVPAS